MGIDLDGSSKKLTKKAFRAYRFDLRDIEVDIMSFIAKGEDVSNAMDNLAEQLGEPDVEGIYTTLKESFIWHPVKREWIKHKPWWIEEKELYEWE